MWNLSLQKTAVALLFGTADQLQECPPGMSGAILSAYGVVCNQLRATEAQALPHLDPLFCSLLWSTLCLFFNFYYQLL